MVTVDRDNFEHNHGLRVPRKNGIVYPCTIIKGVAKIPFLLPPVVRKKGNEIQFLSGDQTRAGCSSLSLSACPLPREMLFTDVPA